GTVYLEIRLAMLGLVGCPQGNGMQQLAIVKAAKLEGFGPHGQWLDERTQPEFVQNLHGVGAHLNAGPHFAKLRRLLEYAYLVAFLEQEGRSRQPANTCTYDQDIHMFNLP